MRKLLAVIAVIVLVVAVAIGVARWLRPPGQVPGPAPAPPSAEAPVNPPGCAAVEVIAIPGTWESRADDDPVNPAANPNSLLLNVTRPLQAAHGPDAASVWTAPYPAQFRNIHAQHEMSYDESQAAGRAVVEERMRATNAGCPATDFILVGFSQGAVIAGDLAADLGHGRGAVPAERVAGVALLADGRREPGKGVPVGNPVAGVGLEVALQPVNAMVQPIVPGATMRGGREGGFGELNDRVMDICAPDDVVCDAPRDIAAVLPRAGDYAGGNAVHAMYLTNPNVVPGTTAPQWTVDWASGLIAERVG
ncbi:cutinase family protein [Corynebacterium sp. 335C]